METIAIKNIIGVISVVLAFIAYASYFRDIFRGTTKPHVFSWFIWGFVTFIAFLLQASAGAGPGAYVTITVSIISFCIFLLSLKNGNKVIKKIDVVFFVTALLAIPIWLVAKQPTFSIILLITIEMLGFGPTVRKSWNDPYSETLSFF